MNIKDKALVFASAAHAAVGQVRKYTGEPYIHHPFAVRSLVERAGGDDHMIAAALLHDVVEDTKVDINLVIAWFGADVAELVEMLTDVSKPEDGNRAQRKAIDLAHTALASDRAKTIKLADLIDNTTSIVERDPEFAKVYLVEKAALLKVLEGGDPQLWARAAALLSASCATLGIDLSAEVEA